MKKVILFTSLFLLGAFFLGLVLKRLDFGRVKSVKFDGSVIHDFILVNKNHNTLHLEGKKAIELPAKIKIFSLRGYIKTKGEKIYIISNKALLDRINKIALLYEDVNISSKNILLSTNKLNINLEKQIAYGDDFCKITTPNSTTVGKEVFINLKKELLFLKNVKTIIER